MSYISRGFGFRSLNFNSALTGLVHASQDDKVMNYVQQLQAFLSSESQEIFFLKTTHCYYTSLLFRIFTVFERGTLSAHNGLFKILRLILHLFCLIQKRAFRVKDIRDLT